VTVAAVHVSVAELRPLPVMLAAPIETLPGPGAFRGLSAEPK
jgi:hypothetical protein